MGGTTYQLANVQGNHFLSVTFRYVPSSTAG